MSDDDFNAPDFTEPKIFIVGKSSWSPVDKTLRGYPNFDDRDNVKSFDKERFSTLPAVDRYFELEEHAKQIKQQYGSPVDLEPMIVSSVKLAEYLRPQSKYFDLFEDDIEKMYSNKITELLDVKNTELYIELTEDRDSNSIKNIDIEFLRCFLLLSFHHYFLDAHLLVTEREVYTKEAEKNRKSEGMFRRLLHDDKFITEQILADFLLLKRNNFTLIQDENMEFSDVEEELDAVLKAIGTLRRSSSYSQLRTPDMKPTKGNRKTKNRARFDLLCLALWVGGVVYGKVPSGYINHLGELGVGITLYNALYEDLKFPDMINFSEKKTGPKPNISAIKKHPEFTDIEKNAIDLHKVILEGISKDIQLQKLHEFFNDCFDYGFVRRCRESEI